MFFLVFRAHAIQTPRHAGVLPDGIAAGPRQFNNLHIGQAGGVRAPGPVFSVHHSTPNCNVRGGLPRRDLIDRWTIQMTGKGFHSLSGVDSEDGTGNLCSVDMMEFFATRQSVTCAASSTGVLNENTSFFQDLNIPKGCIIRAFGNFRKF